MFKLLFTKYMEKREAMTSPTHLHSHIKKFKKMSNLVKNRETSQFHVFLIFHPIFIECSPFCLKIFLFFLLN